ncbi:hypothetical protein CRENBAI_006385 [Crenichthys baileyi]|uniref:Uncharacterized protein n=1 Tax=Crenichthys baileyi TaxID=28760 RepID=A0AAV9RND8_9TELE
MDLADSRQESARDRWVQQQREEAVKHLPTDLEVLPSPLLLEQMEREAALRQRVREGCSVPPPQLQRSPPASSRRKNRRRAVIPSRSAGEEVVFLPADLRATASNPASSSATALSPRLAAAPPKPSSLAPARCSEATPDELEQRLKFYARQIKSFRKTSLLYSSPELMEKIKQMEDYEMAVRQFYCRPPSPTPSHKSAAAAQPTSCLQTAAAAAEQATPGLQGAAAAEQLSPGLQSASAAAAQQSPSGFLIAAAPAQLTPCLLTAAAVEHSTPGLQPAAEFPEGTVGGLPPRPGPEHLLVFLWGVLIELKPDTPQPVSPQPGMKSDSKPDPKSASTSSTCRRGRCKRGASAQVIGGPGDASASAHTTEGLGKASASAHATEGQGDASAPAHATEGPGDASAPARTTEGPGDASAPAPGLNVIQGSSKSLVLVLVPESSVEGFEEEPPLDPVHVIEGFKEQLVLVLASEPIDTGFEEEAPPDPVSGEFKEQLVLILLSEGSPDSVPVSGGPVGSVPVSEGSPDSMSDHEAPGSQPDYEVPGSKPPEFHRASGGPSTLHGRTPDLICFCFCLLREIKLKHQYFMVSASQLLYQWMQALRDWELCYSKRDSQ